MTLRDFIKSYDLVPVRDYTFLGTENSAAIVAKLIVQPDGAISGWPSPAHYVPWLAEAMKAGSYEFGLVDGFLPAVHYLYRQPGSGRTCAMTAFVADRGQSGGIALYLRLDEADAGATESSRRRQWGGGEAISPEDFDDALQALRGRWERFFAEGAQIPCPDPDLLNACKASIIRALITFTGKRPHYGVETYGPSARYDEEFGDGFPPTIISLTDCLLDWGQGPMAREYLGAWFDQFVTEEGRIKYQGPSLSEYGQLMWLARKCMEFGGDREWFERLRPKYERIRQWVWAEQARSPRGLLAGVPEADRRRDIDVYFHNNGWLWRGLAEIAPLLGHSEDQQRCDAFRQATVSAMDEFTDRSVSPHFIPHVARKVAPFKGMTENKDVSYVNYRYWPELLSCGILSREQTEAIIAYRNSHGGEAAGMCHFVDHADNWPLCEYAAGLMALGKRDEVRRILLCHLAGHTTPETWTSYEQVSLVPDETGFRKHGSSMGCGDYCVPAQLVAPRLLAWLNGRVTRFFERP